MSDRGAPSPARETTVCNEGYAQPHSRYRGGWRKHFGHSWSASGPFIAHDHNLPFAHRSGQNGPHRLIFGVEYSRFSRITEHVVPYAGAFDDGAVRSKVPEQHCDAACRVHRIVEGPYDCIVTDVCLLSDLVNALARAGHFVE